MRIRLPLALLACAMTGGCSLFAVRAEEHDPFTTATGLTVHDLVLTLGQGVEIGDEVTIHYSARLESGETFDSSYESGQPVTFVVGDGQVPVGLEEGVLGMARGGRRSVVVPPELAYGAEGVAGRVPPHETVTFVVEVLDVVFAHPLEAETSDSDD